MSDTTMISIVASQRGDEIVNTDRGRFDDLKRYFAARVELSADQIAERLSNFLKTMDEVLAKLPDTMGGFEIDQMELKVEISAKGQVSLLGTGGEVGSTGGLSFTLKRKGTSGATPAPPAS